MTYLQQHGFRTDPLEMLANSDPTFRVAVEQRKFENFTSVFKENFRKNLREVTLQGILEALSHRGIDLKPEDAAVLEGLDYVELPDITVAIDASDAEDFVRRARLR